MKRAVAVVCMLAAGCTPGPAHPPKEPAASVPAVVAAPPAFSAAGLTMADIQPIIEPLTYRELLGLKCGVPNTAVKTAFMDELKAAGAPEALLVQVAAEARRIENEERDTPNEYVCTAELMDSTETNAADAQKAWTELKTRKP